jgi:formate hydrogenlyase subunit 3/multisubunit Na+/H+ antiporter MnhD subunit
MSTIGFFMVNDTSPVLYQFLGLFVRVRRVSKLLLFFKKGVSEHRLTDIMKLGGLYARTPLTNDG